MATWLLVLSRDARRRREVMVKCPPVGMASSALLFLAACKLGVSLWGAGALAGFVGGALQPFLFMNLKDR